MIRLAILKTDYVRTEWVPEFGEYPDMFQAVFRKCDPSISFQTFDTQLNEYPADLDEFDASIGILLLVAPFIIGLNLFTVKIASFYSSAVRQLLLSSPMLLLYRSPFHVWEYTAMKL